MGNFFFCDDFYTVNVFRVRIVLEMSAKIFINSDENMIFIIIL